MVDEDELEEDGVWRTTFYSEEVCIEPQPEEGLGGVEAKMTGARFSRAMLRPAKGREHQVTNYDESTKLPDLP